MGNFSPLYDENDTLEIPRGLYTQSGSRLNGRSGKMWNSTTGNYPLADGLTFQTSQPDVFVGGDVYTGPKFVINAIEAGKCAAESLHSVHPHASLTIGRNRRDFIELDKENAGGKL